MRERLRMAIGRRRFMQFTTGMAAFLTFDRKVGSFAQSPPSIRVSATDLAGLRPAPAGLTTRQMIYSADLSSEAEFLQKAITGSYSLPIGWPPGPQWMVEPSNGMPFVRLWSYNDPTTGVGLAERIIAWYLYFKTPVRNRNPVEEAYGAFAIRIGADVLKGINEAGVKLPSPLACAPDEPGIFNWRFWHGRPRADDTLPLYLYCYDSDLRDGGYDAKLRNLHANVEVEKWYYMEVYAKLNTCYRKADGTITKLSDGLGKAWVNGNLVWDTSGRNWRNLPETKIHCFHANIYHGGQRKYPLCPIHYDLAHLRVDSQRIDDYTTLFGTRG